MATETSTTYEQTQTEQATQTKRGPAVAFESGLYRGKIWVNKIADDGGSIRDALSVSIERRFYNRKTGQWESSVFSIMNPSEIGTVIHLLKRLQDALVRQTAPVETSS